MNPCFLIPIYDHGDTIGDVVKGLAPHGLPCLIVDDGSGESTRRELDRIAAENPWVELYRRAENGGRGAALRDGYRLAGRLGYTHALQLDADCQHDTTDAPRLLEAARRNPDALVLGRPIFDDSAPLNRLYGRKVSQVLVWIETMSFAITDPLCGYRCFPIAPTLQLLDRHPLGDYMDFDPEIAVRLVWQGLRVENVDTNVVYREGGLSHYAPLVDTLRIARAHTQLLLGMLVRSPWLLGRGLARGIRSLAGGERRSEGR